MIALLATVMLTGGLLVIAGMRQPGTARRRHRADAGNPAASVAVALGAGSIALIVTTVPVFALLVATASSFIPGMARRQRAARRRRERAQSWPNLLDDVTSAVRAGLNLPEALSKAGHSAPPQLRPAFAGFDAQYARTGDFTGSLEAMRARVDDRVFDQLVHAMVLARDVGGSDLTQVLRSLGVFVRAELQLRGELLARQSWTVNSARMAVAAPWIVLVMLSARPSTIEAYRSSTGSLVLLAVAVTSAVAYAAMLRIARIEGMVA